MTQKTGGFVEDGNRYGGIVILLAAVLLVFRARRAA